MKQKLKMKASVLHATSGTKECLIVLTFLLLRSDMYS